MAFPFRRYTQLVDSNDGKQNPNSNQAIELSKKDEHDFWRCCNVVDELGTICEKKNITEVKDCIRCGHWICDDCRVTKDPNAPPKEYPKPKDLENTLVRRASVSLKRASTILGRTDTNLKGKSKEVIIEEPTTEENYLRGSMMLLNGRPQAAMKMPRENNIMCLDGLPPLSSGAGQFQKGDKGKENMNANSKGLVRSISTLKRASTLLSRKRQSETGSGTRFS